MLICSFTLTLSRSHVAPSLSSPHSQDEFEIFATNLGFKGDVAVLSQVFTEINADDNDELTYDELAAWLDGRLLIPTARKLAAESIRLANASPTAKEGASPSAQSRSPLGLRDGSPKLSRSSATILGVDGKSRSGESMAKPWGGDRLLKDLRMSIVESGATLASVIEVWDKSGDGQLNREEFLSFVRRTLLGNEDEKRNAVVYWRRRLNLPVSKKADKAETEHVEELLRNQRLWEVRILPAANEAFNLLDSGRDGSVSIVELGRYLGDANDRYAHRPLAVPRGTSESPPGSHSPKGSRGSPSPHGSRGSPSPRGSPEGAEGGGGTRPAPIIRPGSPRMPRGTNGGGEGSRPQSARAGQRNPVRLTSWRSKAHNVSRWHEQQQAQQPQSPRSLQPGQASPRVCSRYQPWITEELVERSEASRAQEAAKYERLLMMRGKRGMPGLLNDLGRR